jgi:phage baseplate assembly protein gpV
MSNTMLRVGEVQAIYYPTDDANISRRFVEYDVWVQHRANKTAVTKMYSHVIAIDHFGSVADFSFATYRVKKTATNEGDTKDLAPGLGAKVILLCINGETNNAVILGGIRDFNSTTDKKEDGHNLHTVFNGIDLSINNDGELTLTYNGATGLDGKPAEKTDQEAAGTIIKISVDGNLLISDGKGENSILVDRAEGKVQFLAKNEIDVAAPRVRLGDNETEDPAVLGDELKGLLEELIDAINSLTVPTSDGPSGTPINASQFSGIRGRLRSMLSGTVFVKK